ncbi:MAG: DNA polymerase ligase N-terminal domain-containing protein [Bacteroidota bacterium]
MPGNDSLSEYRKKRDLSRSPEPGDGRERKAEQRFVIQKHAARSLHYDFRIEVGGVLASWAIPKGPSTDKRVQRLAIHVEDHPADYIDFEGVIPEGEYGAGAVIVWDTGPYRNLMEEKEKPRSIEESIESGHAELWLDGEKLEGGFSLVRINKEKDHWLLSKMDDEHADARRNPVSTEPESVLSGKTIEDLEREAEEERQ